MVIVFDLCWITQPVSQIVLNFSRLGFLSLSRGMRYWYGCNMIQLSTMELLPIALKGTVWSHTMLHCSFQVLRVLRSGPVATCKSISGCWAMPFFQPVGAWVNGKLPVLKPSFHSFRSLMGQQIFFYRWCDHHSLIHSSGISMRDYWKHPLYMQT